MSINLVTRFATGILALAACAMLVGCGGNDNNTPAGQTFFGPDVTATNGPHGSYLLGRSFVRTNGATPLEFGFELEQSGIANQPPTPISDDKPNVYIIPLPAQASASPYKAMALFYFTGHPIDQFRPTGEPQHFHCVMLINPPAQPDPPTFANEFAVPDPREVPVGAPAGVPPTIVPGLGQSYDDPTKPAGQPARITVGMNFLIYKGHINGTPVGDDVSFLQSHQTETDVIDQPQLYPVPGFFPHQWTIRYDAAKQVNVFSVSDFRPVGAAFIPQG